MLTLQAQGLSELGQRFQDMRARAQDLSPAWEEFLDWWADTNVEHFASRGRRWRSFWKPLAPSTVASKRREGLLSEPLVASTRLRGELTGRPLGMERVEASSVEAGTDLPYAIYHQLGAPRAHLPARPLINARAVAAEGAAGSAVLTWIVDGAPNTGGGMRLER